MRYISRALSLVIWIVLASPALAQFDCKTPDCTNSTLPLLCQKRATPRRPTVQMMSQGINFVYSPPTPRIEPGECISWQAVGSQHSSSESHCVPDSDCSGPPPPECLWDTGNTGGLTPAVTTCRYDASLFPPTTANAFYCRIHATPTTGTMRGTMDVTTPIDLRVNKDSGTGSTVLSWTGGGVPPDVTYKVVRNTAGDPAFTPGAATVTANPDGGVAGTTFNDAGAMLTPGLRFYLVRNKQTNES